MNARHIDKLNAVTGPTLAETVVKIGGGTLAHPERFAGALDAIADAARGRRVLIVPGGGPFADTVRSVDDRLRLSDDAAHWMAVLAMDQFAYVVAERLDRGVRVTGPREIGDALAVGRLPVLAPSRWLLDADPLPHAWTVTSDSIAAWVAGRVGASRLVVVKPPGATGDRLLDEYFHQALPDRVTPVVVFADQVDVLTSMLRNGVSSG